jgi:hypothetical protein
VKGALTINGVEVKGGDAAIFPNKQKQDIPVTLSQATGAKVLFFELP